MRLIRRPNATQKERDRDPRLKDSCAACGVEFSKARPSTLCADGYRVHSGPCGINGTLPSASTHSASGLGGIGGW